MILLVVLTLFTEATLYVNAGVFQLPFKPAPKQVNVTQGILSYREFMFEQVLDHYNFNDDRTFQQRLLIQDEWFDPDGGSIFFYAGSRDNIVKSWNSDLFLMENAPRFKALVIFAEHRYYGRSMPFGNRSLDLNNIVFLTVEQALADYANTIKFIKDAYQLNRNNEYTPVIAFGCEYGGLLSAHMRIKYASLVDGAVASAVPLNLIAGTVSRNVFYSEVTRSFSKYPNCVPYIRSCFDLISQVYRQQQPQLPANSTLQGRFRLCRPVANDRDLRQFILFVRKSLSMLSIFNYPYQTAFNSALPANPVKVACDSLILNARDPLVGLREIITLVNNNTVGATTNCTDIYADLVECSDGMGCGTGSDATAFDYQSCVELPLAQETNSLTDVFPSMPFTNEDRRDYCKRKWNVTVRNTADYRLWNSKLAKVASNIVFIDSKNDPWESLTIRPSFDDSITTIKIADGAHTIDLKASHPSDSNNVRLARQEEVQHLERWIKIAKAQKK